MVMGLSMSSLMRAAVVALGAALVLGAGASNAPADAFYKGKRITLLINYGAGGPADIEGRVFAKHLARLIDGNPSVIVQNMDGAGGLVGTSYLGEVAPRDGTMVGHLTGVAWRVANDPSRLRVDFKTFPFIAYQPSTTVYYVRTDVAPGLKVATDIVKAQHVISGGLGADSGKDLLIRLGLEILGVPNRHISNYRNSAQARLALQRGEIQFYSESPPSYRSVVHTGIVKEGLAIPVWHDPDFDGDKQLASKQVADLEIPVYHELHRAITGKLPSGPLWDAFRTIRTISGPMLRVVALPPGAPPAATEALRAAVARLSDDKAYTDDAMKALGFVPDYATGPDVGRVVLEALTVRPEMRAFIADYVRKGSK